MDNKLNIKISLLIFISFLCGWFIGWKTTSDIDMKTIEYLNNKIDDLQVQINETKFELNLSNNKLYSIEKSLKEE